VVPAFVRRVRESNVAWLVAPTRLVATSRRFELWWACITLLFLSIRPQAWRHWVLRPLRPRRVDCSPGHSVRWDRDLGVVLAKRAVAGHEHVLQLSGGINENELCLLKAFLGQLGICWAQRVRVPACMVCNGHPRHVSNPLQLSKSDVALLEQVGGQCP